jgi:aldehyde dehydrogenase (NAD+)
MQIRDEIYIDGAWVKPSVQSEMDVVNPATEELLGRISLGAPADVDRAVHAARKAFTTFSRSSKGSRIALLQDIGDMLEARTDQIANIISQELGAPITFAKEVQTALSVEHIREAIRTLKEYRFESTLHAAEIVREPIGVCGLITAWNWPINLIISKLAYALAAGCTVVLKPSEFTTLSAAVLTDIVHDCGCPPGVFNMVSGDGASVGHAISSHPDIDMVSFTGSTRAGILVAKAAADSVKRVHQELGGKSANIILRDASLQSAVPAGVLRAFSNSGQSCQAPTRMFVHSSQYGEAVEIAKATAEAVRLGDPADPATTMGPLISQVQFDRVQSLIKSGYDEGATVVTGGLGRAEGLNKGFYVRPTIFSNVSNNMRIAREEIFGPVLPILSYDSEEEAIELANDTAYGLANYIQTGDTSASRHIAARLRSGRVYINTMRQDVSSPFGGYKQSGNGRELGAFGLEEFLEVKAIIGPLDGTMAQA